jgi:hypothetical protein
MHIGFQPYGTVYGPLLFELSSTDFRSNIWRDHKSCMIFFRHILWCFEIKHQATSKRARKFRLVHVNDAGYEKKTMNWMPFIIIAASIMLLLLINLLVLLIRKKRLQSNTHHPTATIETEPTYTPVRNAWETNFDNYAIVLTSFFLNLIKIKLSIQRRHWSYFLVLTHLNIKESFSNITRILLWATVYVLCPQTNIKKEKNRNITRYISKLNEFLEK